MKHWRGIIKGPWIHQNVIETIKNIRLRKKITGGVKVNESDGFCASLPYFLYGFDFKSLEKIISTVNISKMSQMVFVQVYHTFYMVMILKV